MMAPEIKKFPTEIFCYSFTDKSEQARKALEQQYCYFLKGVCNKPRKSEPNIKVGVCSLGGPALQTQVALNESSKTNNTYVCTYVLRPNSPTHTIYYVLTL